MNSIVTSISWLEEILVLSTDWLLERGVGLVWDFCFSTVLLFFGGHFPEIVCESRSVHFPVFASACSQYVQLFSSTVPNRQMRELPLFGKSQDSRRVVLADLILENRVANLCRFASYFLLL